VNGEIPNSLINRRFTPKLLPDETEEPRADEVNADPSPSYGSNAPPWHSPLQEMAETSTLIGLEGG